MPINVLCIGDAVGKKGRRAIQKQVPKLRKKYDLDLVVANIENLAHGKGVTKKTFTEIKDVGIDVFTSGNHVWKQEEAIALLNDDSIPFIRPANYPEGTPGRGYEIVTIDTKKILVMNVMGRVFMKMDLDDPFRCFDRIAEENKDVDAIIVDFHAETTSEKRAFGYYIEGRASLFVGTHTHVPTADAEIIGKGKLGYVTDLGMVGPHESVLGVGAEEIIDGFLTQRPVKHTMVTSGKTQFNSVFATLQGMETTAIKRVDYLI